MTPEQIALFNVIDSLTQELLLAIQNEGEDIRWIDWLSGRIGGMLFAARLGKLMDPAATKLLQEVINSWYQNRVAA